MKFTETEIEGCYVLDFFHIQDDRGSFVKPMHRGELEAQGLDGQFDESFYSVNSKGVVRGMHFQLPPQDHSKIVYCTSGRLLDVILDLRKSSPSYGKTVSVELSGDNFKGVYLPKGCAHGFAVLEDQTCMIYLTSTVHSPEHDSGVLWNSFGFEWPIEEPIQSERDLSFKALAEFESPF
ncbi:MAG TPA: dTDP-4-dehydrorhamnose 3,5-epimerase [Flavobacteriales bacterium]|jgi:dTDP-4-dehydrorhamnose 3,5-epimerase/CDP-3, 6-dideoxy-D-glycero-D-glycero-4-hexulose-5-epimerase|nr:dTDP-4-dehydrorhamnose 3,5-epimerase family protein [Salibacteraceae bacterium]HAS35354.1 dTDP-4-dehydrorhamnose 3,5-epimerase [Flavobacteriales bacterium]